MAQDLPARARGVHWRSVLLGGAIAIGLSFLAGIVAGSAGSLAAAALLGALAFVAAGALTVRLVATAAPRDPAIGAALAVAILGTVQLLAYREREPDVGVSQVLLSLAVSVAFAGALTWLGGRLGDTARTRRRLREPPAGPVMP